MCQVMEQHETPFLTCSPREFSRDTPATTAPALRKNRLTDVSLSLSARFDSITQSSNTPPTRTPGETLQWTGVPLPATGQNSMVKPTAATPGPESPVCFLKLVMDSTICLLTRFGLHQYIRLDCFVHEIHTAARIWVLTLFDSALQV